VLWDESTVKVTAAGDAQWTGPLASNRVTPGLHRVTITAVDALKLADLTVLIESR
jgi:hypothetical protein